MIPGEESIVPSNKKRKVASMTNSITDIKNDHEKKRPGVKFESPNLTVATVKEKMNKLKNLLLVQS